MKILIETECNDKTCGKCRLVLTREDGTEPVCCLFVKHLEETESDRKRLPECMAAYKG